MVQFNTGVGVYAEYDDEYVIEKIREANIEEASKMFSGVERMVYDSACTSPEQRTWFNTVLFYVYSLASAMWFGLTGYQSKASEELISELLFAYGLDQSKDISLLSDASFDDIRLTIATLIDNEEYNPEIPADRQQLDRIISTLTRRYLKTEKKLTDINFRLVQ